MVGSATMCGHTGKVAMARGKTHLDWEIIRASEIPGPAAYGAIQLPAPQGGKFNVARPLSESVLPIFVRPLASKIDFH